MDEPLKWVVENADLRSDVELLLRAYRALTLEVDRQLRDLRLGRLHYRILVGIRLRPGGTASHYLDAPELHRNVAQQLVCDLIARDLVEERDARSLSGERGLFLTKKGAGLERELSEPQLGQLARAYDVMGSAAAGHFRGTLALIAAQPRNHKESAVSRDLAAQQQGPARDERGAFANRSDETSN